VLFIKRVFKDSAFFNLNQNADFHKILLKNKKNYFLFKFFPAQIFDPLPIVIFFSCYIPNTSIENPKFNQFCELPNILSSNSLKIAYRTYLYPYIFYKMIKICHAM